MTVGAAVAPEQIRPPVAKPADFDSFWAGKLAALKQVPINPRLEPTATDREGVELFTVTLDSLNSQVHGYLATPKGGGKHPALVIYQYAGVYPLQKSVVTDRAAEGWLALDVDSHDMPPDQATAPSNYARIGNDDRETSYFLNMYLRDTRALDYIQSRPDWDGKTIVIMGTSMGGQQSFVTAGLNPGQGHRHDRQCAGGRRFQRRPAWQQARLSQLAGGRSQGGGDGALFRRHEFRARHQAPKAWWRWG